MLSLPQELILSILEYTDNEYTDNEYTGNSFQSFRLYVQDRLKDIFNLWLTCKHFDYLKDKYYTIKRSVFTEVSIFTCTLLDQNKFHGYSYGFTYNNYSPEHLTFCHYYDNKITSNIYQYNYQMTRGLGKIQISSVINDVVYKSDKNLHDNITNQIYDQWDNVDKLTKNWLLENNRSILIRNSISTNKYIINVPHT